MNSLNWPTYGVWQEQLAYLGLQKWLEVFPNSPFGGGSGEQKAMTQRPSGGSVDILTVTK